MRKKLEKLFDYQRFEKNASLEKLISECESRYGERLSDEDLAAVSAAGSLDLNGYKLDRNLEDPLKTRRNT